VLFFGVTLGADGEAAIRAARLRAAHDLVGQMLSGHQEARSLLSEASHRRVLAEQSTEAAASAAATADVARLRYEELNHRVDPRAQRPLPFWMVLVLVVTIGAVLAGLARIELTGLPGREVAAAAVAAAWIAGAWMAAAGRREGDAGRTAAAWVAALALTALLTVLHAVAAPADWGCSLAGLLWAGLSGAIAVTAAALIRRTEPVALAQARKRWRRAQADHAAAIRTSLADAQSAAIARESWLSLVRSAAAGQGDEQLTRDATNAATEMI
jgi:uncharacterized membrane protein YhaH (DUF805 family)